MTDRTPNATPPAGSRFDALEGWRGIACLMVFAYHCGVNLRQPPVAVFGFCGVHLFFVLSGYLLFKPYAEAMAGGWPVPDTRRFYARRLLRIVPPYLVSLAAFVLLRVATGVHRPGVGNVLLHATLAFNYDPRVDFFSINAVYWSLAIEVQFYLLLPAACLAVGRVLRGRPAVLACVIGFVVVGVLSRFAEVRYLRAYYAAVGNADGVRFRSVLAYLDLFGFGMAVAACGTGQWAAALGRRSTRAGLAVAGVAVVVAANDWCARSTGGAWQSGTSDVFLTGFCPVLCSGVGLLLLAVVSHPGGGAGWLRAWPLRRAGEISYSLYLYHTGVQFFVIRLGLGRTWGYTPMTLLNATVSLGPAVVAAAVMYYLVERPSLQWVARVRAGGPRAAGVAASSSIPSSPSSDALLGP